MRIATVLVALTATVCLAAPAAAKLPDPSPEAKEAAAAKKAQADHGTKVAAYQLCLSQNAVATRHRGGGKGKDAKKLDLPACADPGKFDPAKVAAAPAPAKK